MGQEPSIDAYIREVWSAVGTLWPNLGADPAAVVRPYIPVLPAFLAEAHGQGRTPESSALETMKFFLRIYVENALGEDERKALLVDLHQLSKLSFEESQTASVLPFTAALVTAQQTVSKWKAEKKVESDAAKSLNREVLSALLGKASGEISRLGWLTIETARKKA